MATIVSTPEYVVLKACSAVVLAETINKYFKEHHEAGFIGTKVVFHGTMIFCPATKDEEAYFIQSLIKWTPVWP